MPIIDANLVKRFIEVIAKTTFNVCLYFLLGRSSPCKENRRGCCLSSLYSFRVIVCRFSAFLRLLKNLVQRIECKADRTDSHGGSVTQAVIGSIGPVSCKKALNR